MRGTRCFSTAAALLAGAACLWAVLAAIGENANSLVEPLARAGGLLHAAAYLFLLWLFARTLRPGNEALITRVARKVHGELAPEIAAYTRRVTLTWCLFFAAQIVVSGMLLAFASFRVWSFFTVALNLPLLALMFVGEYGYRILRYPDHPRVSIGKSLRAFGQTAMSTSNVKAR